MIIDGKLVSQQIKTELKNEIAELAPRNLPKPNLTVIVVGDDPASAVYVRNKERACQEVGIESKVLRFLGSVPQECIIEAIHVLNESDDVHGILVQLPLPKHINEQEVLQQIDPKKDVDGFHPYQVGALSTGLDCLKPCTPSGIIALLKTYNIPMAGRHAVVIGRSNIVGKPIAQMLLQEDATVSVCHSRTPLVKLHNLTSTADIVVVAVGRPNFLTADMVKPGAVVIDVGINRLDNGKLCGDVDFEEVKDKVMYVTPVPGGVGPMTITMLLRNTLDAYYNQLGLPKILIIRNN